MPRKETYKVIRDRIASTMPWVKWIDLQKGQFDTPAKTYPLPLPCILIEVKSINWTSYLNKRQMGDAIVSIYIYLQVIGDSIKGTQQEEYTLSMFDKINDPFQYLTDLAESNVFKRLVRISDYIVGYKPGLAIYKTDFSTTLYDQIMPPTAPLPGSNITVSLTP